MTLYEICREIGEVEEGLMYGEISFTYDSLMSAMKPGHPADILDDILSVIGWDVFAGKEPEKEKVKQVLARLREFKRCFKVKELNAPIKHLNEYLNPKTPYTFEISVGDSGTSYVEYTVTEREFKLIRKAKEEFESFSDVEKLEALHRRVEKAAVKQLRDDLDLTGDDIDPDDLDINIDFGDEEDEF